MIRKSNPRKSLLLAMAAVAVAALLAALPLVAQPQGPGGGPGAGFGPGHGFAGPGHHAGGPGRHGGGHGFLAGRGFERLARFLVLSEEQRAQAQAIHQATREQAQPIFEESRSLRGELHALLDQPAPSATAVGEKVLALDAHRDQLRQLHENARARFEALLTPEQLEKLEDLHERRGERRERRGGRGFGPRGGPF